MTEEDTLIRSAHHRARTCPSRLPPLPKNGPRFGVKGYCYMAQPDHRKQPQLSPTDVDRFFVTITDQRTGRPCKTLRPEMEDEWKDHAWNKMTYSETHAFASDPQRIGMPLKLEHGQPPDPSEEPRPWTPNPIGRVNKLRFYPNVGSLKFTAEVHGASAKFVRPGMRASLLFTRGWKTGRIGGQHETPAPEISVTSDPFFRKLPALELGGDSLLASACSKSGKTEGYVTQVFPLDGSKSSTSEYITPPASADAPTKTRAMSDEQGKAPVVPPVQQTDDPTKMDTSEDGVPVEPTPQPEGTPPKDARKQVRDLVQKKQAQAKVTNEGVPATQPAPGGGQADPFLAKSREDILLLAKRQQKQQELLKTNVQAEVDRNFSKYVAAAQHFLGERFNPDNMSTMMKSVMMWKMGELNETTSEGQIAALMAQHVERMLAPSERARPAGIGAQVDPSAPPAKRAPTNDRQRVAGDTGQPAVGEEPELLADRRRKVSPHMTLPSQIEASLARQQAMEKGLQPSGMNKSMPGSRGAVYQQQLAELGKRQMRIDDLTKQLAQQQLTMQQQQLVQQQRLQPPVPQQKVLAPPVMQTGRGPSDIKKDFDAIFGDDWLSGRLQDQFKTSNDQYRRKLNATGMGGMGGPRQDPMGMKFSIGDNLIVAAHSRAKNLTAGYFSQNVDGYDPSSMDSMLRLRKLVEQQIGGDPFVVNSDAVRARDQEKYAGLFEQVPDPSVKDGEQPGFVDVFAGGELCWSPVQARQMMSSTAPARSVLSRVQRQFSSPLHGSRRPAGYRGGW